MLKGRSASPAIVLLPTPHVEKLLLLLHCGLSQLLSAVHVDSLVQRGWGGLRRW
jgi:hypothetical protein